MESVYAKEKIMNSECYFHFVFQGHFRKSTSTTMNRSQSNQYNVRNNDYESVSTSKS